MAHAVRSRVLALELAHELAADEGGLCDDVAEGGVELVLVSEVLGVEIDEWNAHGRRVLRES